MISIKDYDKAEELRVKCLISFEEFLMVVSGKVTLDDLEKERLWK